MRSVWDCLAGSCGEPSTSMEVTCAKYTCVASLYWLCWYWDLFVKSIKMLKRTRVCLPSLGKGCEGLCYTFKHQFQHINPWVVLWRRRQAGAAFPTDFIWAGFGFGWARSGLTSPTLAKPTHATVRADFVTFHPDCQSKMKWIGFRPALCTYRLNWARRTSWGWWDDWVKASGILAQPSAEQANLTSHFPRSEQSIASWYCQIIYNKWKDDLHIVIPGWIRAQRGFEVGLWWLAPIRWLLLQTQHW